MCNAFPSAKIISRVPQCCNCRFSHSELSCAASISRPPVEKPDRRTWILRTRGDPICQAYNFLRLLHTFKEETNMKKLITVFFALSLLMCGVTVAQDTMKQDTMKADKSAKAVKVTGKISDDGKTFVDEKDSKSWTDRK